MFQGFSFTTKSPCARSVWIILLGNVLLFLKSSWSDMLDMNGDLMSEISEHMPFYPDNDFSSCSFRGGESVDVFPANFYCVFWKPTPLLHHKLPEEQIRLLLVGKRGVQMKWWHHFTMNFLMYTDIFSFYITHIEIDDTIKGDWFCIERPSADGLWT